MADRYKYVIVGGQLAGGSAVEGIREIDREGEILMIGRDEELPYHRPPLSKGLWFGKKKRDELYLHERSFYADQGVELRLGAEVTGLELDDKVVRCGDGKAYYYDRLLLATGGQPRRLPIPNNELAGIYYYRTTRDYDDIKKRIYPGISALIIGGGFIGSEIAAAFQSVGVEVTMVFDGPYLVDRVFPRNLGMALQEEYARKGLRIFANENVGEIKEEGSKITANLVGGRRITADFVVVGIGITPEIALAENAGIKVDNGIVVDELLETTAPGVFAAGDNAYFPYEALASRMRIEHWDNAVCQGKQAGRNMAGAGERYTYMPYFFSDLYEFGYEAVGEVDSRLEVVEDWEDEYKKGVLYYLSEGVVRGIMLCNVWDKVDAARSLIREKTKTDEKTLKGAIA